MAIHPRAIRPSPGARRVKAWARCAFGLGEDGRLLVTQLPCGDPRCPGLETVIAIVAGPGKMRRYTIGKPLLDVTEADVQALAARNP